ncbi:MAG: carboxymuconolactone decarboxylase family protein [Pseudomonadota bacterium]
MRITPVTPGTQPELAEIEATITATRGRIGPLYQALLVSPPMADGWEKMLTAVRNHNSLPEALRELLIVRVAVLNRCPSEVAAHQPAALKLGASQQQVDALHAPATPGTGFTPAEQVLLELADTMTRNIEVPAELYARVRSHWEERQIVDAGVTISAYSMVTRFVAALEI